MKESEELKPETLKESQKLEEKIAGTIAEQLKVFDSQFNAIIAQVSDVYVLNIIAAKKHEFILELVAAIESKLAEQMTGLRNFQIALGTELIAGLNAALTDKTLAKEKATAKRIEAGELPEFSLPSYQAVLEQKRNQQFSLVSLKVPDNPTNYDLQNIKMIGTSLEEIQELRNNKPR